jgi:TM2 domain-containing membrane protein YozV
MKSKTTAVLLALFLGGLGIHKFYLGQSGTGIIYLLFCWTLIPGLIACIDFIILLVMSDHDFNMKYNHSQARATGFVAETSKDKAGTLAELKNLFDSGVITAEEYEAKRRKMLDSI